MTDYKTYLREFLLVNFFILDVFTATISHFTITLFILKILCSVVLLSLILYDIHLTKNKLNTADSVVKEPSGLSIAEVQGKGILSLLFSKRLNILFGILTAYFAVTITYSSNPGYGALKLLNFLIGCVPAVYAFGYLTRTLSRRRVKVFLISVITFSVLSVIAVLIIRPFHYLGSFNISVTDWSHVIYGRFIGSVFIVLAFFQLSAEDRNRIIFLFWGVLFSFTGLLLSGYRAGTIGAAGIAVLFILFLLFTKKLKPFNFILFAAACAIGIFTIIFFVPGSNPVTARYSVLQDYEGMEFKGDESIQSHLGGYDVAEQMFYDSPVFGEGFGSFKNYNGNSLSNYINYPHNIFLEFASELGAAGLLVFLFLLYLIFYYSYRFSPVMIFFFLFALFLAQFSKDISSNVLLWLGLGTIELKNSAKHNK